MNAQVHHIEREERKINELNNIDYVTSSQSDEGLHDHNTSKMFVRTYHCLLYPNCVLRINGRTVIRRGGKVANYMGGM